MIEAVCCGCGGKARVILDMQMLAKPAVEVKCEDCGIMLIRQTNQVHEAVEAWNRAMGWVPAEDETIDKGLLKLLHDIMMPHEFIACRVNIKGLHRALKSLPEREQKVLMMYYCEGGKTYDDIAKEFGVTRERIRQVKERGLRIMRHPTLRRWYCEQAE